ncbi:hypothetical protein RHSIM_Rhsim01G0241300 [Rhododendron simsii]|uniref:Nodulin-like domain-containing protein n=1 Tax=Rhododendron simsii TaxID=118357 RepID=A0A834LZB1_RHOSS|nr:hypothetical protein RHSIM_Rhsim01G0241300 [Rhododendron simsii]
MALQWLILVGAIWLQSINGTNSNFPAYSSEFKRLLSLSQLQLNNLAFASDAGKLLGFISGVVASHLPLWLVLLIGSLLGLVGYGVQYLFLSDHIPFLSYGIVFLLTVLSGNSICWINTVCYMITISTFPFDRHVAVGLTTSYIGLSAEIYTDLVSVFFPSSPSSSPAETAKAYLLLNSVSPLVVCVFCAPIVRCANNGESRRLEGGFVVMSKCMASTPASIATIMAPMSASFFLLLNKTTLSLYISTAVIGLCTGAITSIAVSTTTELFGAKNFSVNHNIVVANIPIGSFVFGNAAALLYRSKINTEDGRCMGTECYQTTFVIWGFLCLFGSFLSIILFVRTKKMYAQRL